MPRTIPGSLATEQLINGLTAQFDAYQAPGRYLGKQVRVASEQARLANSSAEQREALDAWSGSN